MGRAADLENLEKSEISNTGKSQRILIGTLKFQYNAEIDCSLHDCMEEKEAYSVKLSKYYLSKNASSLTNIGIFQSK